MFKAVKLIPITATLILLTSATGCTSPTPTPSMTATIPAAEKGVSTDIARKIPLQSEMRFTDDNFLITQENEKITINAYGKLDTVAFKEGEEAKKPAEGEVFHAINYISTTGTQVKPSLDVDGKAITLSKKLSGEGTLIVSAPEEAKIILNLASNDLTQSIDFKTAERTSIGVADVWYRGTEGTITNGTVSETFAIQGKNVVLDYAVTKATRTAYSPTNKWADAGKSAWVVIDGKKPAWKIPDNGGTDNVTQKFTLKDATGKEYALVETPESSTDSMHLEFKVPANVDSYILKLDSSADITYFGEVQGTATITSEKAQIAFKAEPEPVVTSTSIPTTTPTASPSPADR